MKKNVRLGLDLGVFTIPESSLIDIEDIDEYDPGDICIISTGSQGEPMSALGLMARGENKWLKLDDHDTVVLSSHAIPGNESNVNKVIDGLLRVGAHVVHSGVMDVHATGHAQADDIKTYLSIVNPEWFVPIHGEYRHMVANAKLGELMGVRGDRRSWVRPARCGSLVRNHLLQFTVSCYAGASTTSVEGSSWCSASASSSTCATAGHDCRRAGGEGARRRKGPGARRRSRRARSRRG